MNVVLTCSVCLSSAPSAKKFTMQQYLKRQRHLLHGMESRVLKYIPKVDVKLIENKTFFNMCTIVWRNGVIGLQGDKKIMIIIVIYHYLYQVEIDFGFDWIWFIIFPVCSFFCILFCWIIFPCVKAGVLMLLSTIGGGWGKERGCPFYLDTLQRSQSCFWRNGWKWHHKWVCWRFCSAFYLKGYSRCR